VNHVIFFPTATFSALFIFIGPEIIVDALKVSSITSFTGYEENKSLKLSM
jgi:hypothetical protein